MRRGDEEWANASAITVMGKVPVGRQRTNLLSQNRPATAQKQDFVLYGQIRRAVVRLQKVSPQLIPAL